MSISIRIQKLIESKKLTKSAFAKEIGIQRSSLAHFFSGRNKPKESEIESVLILYKDGTYKKN